MKSIIHLFLFLISIGVIVFSQGLNKVVIAHSISNSQHSVAESDSNKLAIAAIDFESEMVLVERGTFIMGCTDEQGDQCEENEKPKHSVTLNSFYISRYEVTQLQWLTVMGTNPSINSNCESCPVENISWNEVQEFISKLNGLTGKNFRLPTEAEWEYAARGGSSADLTNSTVYAGSNSIDEVAWYWSNSDKKSQPVGLKKPNSLGLYDMSGNVYEWCSDIYGKFSKTSKTNPKGFSSGIYRILRGGGWYYYEWLCRVSSRYYSNPRNKSPYFGFRLAMDY